MGERGPVAAPHPSRAKSKNVTGALQKLRGAGRIGFLFTGGSKRCAFQVGVAEGLLELGVHPSLCLGVSAGAWNAAAAAVGAVSRLRAYWRFFERMPYVDLRNLAREHSPFNYSRAHERAFRRYVGPERLRSGKPLLVAVTRLRDRAPFIFDACEVEDPFRLLLATNYLPPFYTHPVLIQGEKFGDGGLSNNLPYEVLLERGCDVVALIGVKGESEGGLYRNPQEFDHEIPAEYRDRVVVFRPHHRLPLSFAERRWPAIERTMNLGYSRAREILLGEPGREPETPDTRMTVSQAAYRLGLRWLAATAPAGSSAQRVKSPPNETQPATSCSPG